jgi:hypothetical protein
MDSIKRLYGVYRAVVVDNKDPNNLRRLKVQSQATGVEVTDWIWPIQGTAKPPLIGQGVFIMYQGGDPEFPLWIGEFGKPELTKGVFAHGSWFSTVDQTASSTSTEYLMSVNNTDYSEGIAVKDGNKFTVDYDAVYNFQFSAQLQHRTGGGGGSGESTWIWLKKNGSTVANSATKLSIPTGKYLVAAWNFFVKLEKNDYVQLAWSVDTLDIALEANSTTSPAPAVPSLIVTMNQVA